MGTITVHRRGYTRKDGTYVLPTTYETEDRGKPGKTPESQRFYHPDVEMDWHKDKSAETRRSHALKAHSGDKLATARSLQALANVTTDEKTAELAKKDADYFFKKQDEEE